MPTGHFLTGPSSDPSARHLFLPLYADRSLPLWPVVWPVGPSSFSETPIICRDSRRRDSKRQDSKCAILCRDQDSRRRDNGIGTNVKTLSLAVLTPNVPWTLSKHQWNEIMLLLELASLNVSSTRRALHCCPGVNHRRVNYRFQASAVPAYFS